MRRAAIAATALVVIATGGCIPQVEEQYREAHPAPLPADPESGPRYHPTVPPKARDDRYRPVPPPGDLPQDRYRPTVPPDDVRDDRYPSTMPRDDVPADRYRAPPSDDDDRYRSSASNDGDRDPPTRAAAPVEAMPTARPVWEARPATPDAVTVAAGDYVVRDGDTLTRIAGQTGTAAGAIAQANGLQRPYTVAAGQRLAIPGGRYHTVHPGEAGIAIARAYGVPWSQIVAANDLAEPFVLRVGERVLIPGTTPDSNRLADRAAAFTLNIDDILTGGEPAPARNQPPAPRVTTPTRVLPPTVVVAPPPRLRGGFAWPLEGRIVRRFGPGGTGQRNDGVEIAAATGTAIHATADGVVAYVGDGIAALGGLVIVKHGDGWTSVYGHASRLLVQRGQSVRQGQTIALSGDTGYADRPEVHFELRKGRTPVDPTTQLPRR